MAESQADGETRRDFLFLAAGAVGAVGAVCIAWPLLDQMNPTSRFPLAGKEGRVEPANEGWPGRLGNRSNSFSARRE